MLCAGSGRNVASGGRGRTTSSTWSIRLGRLKDIITSKARFHFESFWPSLDGFLETVEVAWNSVQPLQCPVQTLSLKFKAIAKALQSWSQKKVGHISSQLALAK
jgi:hypothetical protein